MNLTFRNLKNGRIKISVISTNIFDDPYNGAIRGDEYECDAYAELFPVGLTRCAYVLSNVSPNNLRSGKIPDCIFLAADDGGVPGNSNRQITRYHGWRGTTNDRSVTAIGLRRVEKNQRNKRGYGYQIILSEDLSPELE